MHDDDRVVDKPESEKADAGNVQDKLLLHLEGNILLGLRLKMLGVGELAARDDQQDDGYRAGDGKKRKTGGIDLIRRSISLEEHDKIEEHRTDERTDLIEHLLQTRALAHTLLRGSKGHDGVLRGFLYRLAHALHDEQSARGDPAVLTNKKGEQRHSHNIEHIARDSHGPVALCLVGQLAENIAHGIADKLAKAGDEADGRRGGVEQREICPRMLDAPSCVISEKRLTMPKRIINSIACESFFFLFSISPALSCHVKSV